MNKNRLEWTVFGVSVVLIAGVLGLLLQRHVTSGTGPAAIRITLGEAVSSGAAYAVPVEVRNSGDTTVEDVHVSVTLTGGGRGESSEVTLPYVPYRSQRRAWVTFSRQPSTGQLEARVIGYREP